MCVLLQKVHLCRLCGLHLCMVRAEMSGLTVAHLRVFHKVNLAEKNRLHTRPHPVIHVRPGLLSSYKRLSHWCYPQQQLC